MTTLIVGASASGQSTFLEICRALAKNVGLVEPDVVFTSQDRAWAEAIQFANEQGRELLRRADWGALLEAGTVVGSGADVRLDLPADFERIAKGIAVTHSSGNVRPLSRAEWGALTPVEGSPRYFLLEEDKLRFWPYLATGDSVSVNYISANWCSSGAQLATDADTVVFDAGLFTLGLIVRWRRQKGMDYADFEAEYEAALADFAQFDDRARF